MSALIAFFVFVSPFARARISTAQEMRYLTETLGAIARDGGYELDAESLSVHSFSAQEDASYGFRWWNTPSGNQDHTILVRVTKGDVTQMRTIFFMSQASRIGRQCRLHNATSRRMTSAFDGHETCVTLYLKPRRKHVIKTPTMDTIRVARPLLWDAFGSKRP